MVISPAPQVSTVRTAIIALGSSSQLISWRQRTGGELTLNPGPQYKASTSYIVYSSGKFPLGFIIFVTESTNTKI